MHRVRMMGGPLYHNGMRVVESNHLPKFKVVQYRFPKSKSPRIKKKYRKDTSNFRQVPIPPQVIVMGNTIIMPPETAHQLRNGEFK